MYFIFPLHLSGALPCETGNPEIVNCIFSFKHCMLLCQQMQNVQNYHLVTAAPSFIHKMINYMHQTGPSKGA